MNHRAELFVALQRLLPKHTLSRLLAKAAESKTVWLKNALIKRAIASFDINIDEAESSDINDYKSFNSFFIIAQLLVHLGYSINNYRVLCTIFQCFIIQF